ADIPVGSLRPVQTGFFAEKAQRGRDFLLGKEGKSKRLVVSRDGYLIDGHHQYVAAVDHGVPIRAYRIDLDVGDAFAMLAEMDLVEKDVADRVRDAAAGLAPLGMARRD